MNESEIRITGAHEASVPPPVAKKSGRFSLKDMTSASVAGQMSSIRKLASSLKTEENPEKQLVLLSRALAKARLWSDLQEIARTHADIDCSAPAELLSAVFEVTTKAFPQSAQSKEMGRVAIRGFQFLMEVNPAQKDLYLSKVAKVHLLQGNISLCMKELGTIAQKYPTRLQHDFSILKPTPESLSIFHEHLTNTLEEEAINNTLKILRELKSQNEIPAEEKKEVENALVFALANRKLNEVVRPNPGKTDAFLAKLTYATMENPSCQPTLARIQDALKSSGIAHFLASVQSFDENVQSTKTALQELATFREGLPQPSQLSTMLDRIQSSASALTPASHQPKWQYATGDERSIQLEKLKNQLSSIRGQLQSITLPAKEKKRLQKLIETAIGTVSSQMAAAQDLKNQIDRFQHIISDPSYIPPLHASDLRTLYRYKQLERGLDALQHVGLAFEHPRLKMLFGEVKEARNLFSTINNLIQYLPGYLPGDILLTDEGKHKRYEGGEKVVFSEQSVLRHPSVALTILKEGTSKGIFAVQPYFSGSRIHASMIGSFEGDISTVEVVSRFHNYSTDFDAGLTNVAYRPHFASQLSPEGKQALELIWGKMPDEVLDVKLQSLYSEALTTFVETNKPMLEQLRNNAMKASQAYIRDVTQRLPSLVERLVSNVWEHVHHSYKKGAITWRLPTEDEMAAKNKVFCSELVANLMKEVRSLMEQKLNTLAGTQNNPIEFLKPVISETVDTASIHPNRLEALIRDTYTPIPPPLAVRILFQET